MEQMLSKQFNITQLILFALQFEKASLQNTREQLRFL